MAGDDEGATTRRNAPGHRGRTHQRGVLPIDDRERGAEVATLRAVLAYRMLAAVAVAVAVALVPLFGPHRLALAAVIVLMETAVNAHAARAVRLSGHLPSAVAWADTLLALAVVALVPESYAIAVTVVVSTSGLFVIWFGRRVTLLLVPLTGAGLLAVGLASRPTLWFPAFVAWLITSVSAAVVLSRVADALVAGRDRYDDLVNGLDAAIWESEGPDGPPDYVSRQVVELFGFTPAQLADAEWLAGRVHPDDLPAVVEGRRRIRSGEDVEARYRMQANDGRWIRVLERVRVSTAADGRVLRRRGFLVDETARWESESSLRRYQELIDELPIALVVIRADDPADPRTLRVLAANPAAGELVGLPVPANLGSRVGDLLGVSDELLGHLAEVATAGRPYDRADLHLPGVDGVFAMRAVPLPDGAVGVSLEDVTARARQTESFRHRALHDTLTGLPNRALLHERLTRALIRADRDADRVALLLIDLDEFKEVNDALGHEYGDGLLREVARRLSAEVREGDTVARLGGDEFAVVLASGATEEQARDVARRLGEACARPAEIGDYRVQVSASIGIALAPDQGNDAPTLMRRADSAMYEAKGAGTRIALHSTNQELRTVRRLELLADLRDALDEDAFVVHYQPRLDLRTGRTDGVEALVRWHHPRHGLLAPDEFIELAEVSGAIRTLTKTVTERAATEVGALDGPALRVSVNLSSRNLFDPGLVDWVEGVVDRLDLQPGQLSFELTESQLMDDPSQAETVLWRLHDLGVRCSLDDFGSGPSSLDLLRRLPLDELKIDRHFVADLAHGDERVVRSAISLGHHLGLEVVAEGVESPAVLARLRHLGCDAAQGFHLSGPLPLDELRVHLDDAAAVDADDDSPDPSRLGSR
ncbi:MAG: putative bifunctional diguanylate cyclase/phosphodiesterase [Microthrixaceae bacterium]